MPVRARLESQHFKVLGAVLLVLNCVAAAGLALHDTPTYDSFWDFWCWNSLMVLPVLACFARAWLGGPRRRGAVFLGLAMLAFGSGSVIFLGWTQFEAEPAVPSASDIAYLVFYPFVGAALVSLLRREGDSPTRGLWLDGALGAAGAATALAVVISPTFTSGNGGTGVVLVGAAYSVADLLLIGMIFGVVAVRGLRGSSMWLWLGIGLLTFCVADVAYAVRIATGVFVVGTLWSSLWAIGITISALSLWLPERPRTLEAGRSTAMLMIPMLAVAIAVTGLVVSSFTPLPATVVALATLTVGLAAARTVTAFRQVRRLTDAHRQAVTDELTGLGNRRALFEFGGTRLAGAKPSERIALMLIDLDDFKQVNDSLGHQAGDQLLQETGRRLAARVSHPDFVARLGGDEFALILTLNPDDDARYCAQRVLDRTNQPLVIDGAQLRVDASAGVAEIPGDGASISELLRRADVAMYAAKVGSERLALYDRQLDEDNRARLRTIQDLDGAIVRNEFLLHYQPKIDVPTGRICGAEALVRWQHPTRGLLYPDSFLPLVESCGLMSSVTRLVLHTAVEQIAAWRDDGLAVTVAVNLSASDLMDEQLADRVRALLDAHDLPVGALELEITESVLMTDPDRARKQLECLRKRGVRIAVDDYGTGYSALAYLRDLAVDELKIDRSFIARMSDDPHTAAIVRSTIELAHALGLGVVGEGVEHERDLDMLAAYGCDFAQGYYFSRPLLGAAFANYAIQAKAEPRPARPRFVATVSSLSRPGDARQAASARRPGPLLDSSGDGRR